MHVRTAKIHPLLELHTHPSCLRQAGGNSDELQEKSKEMKKTIQEAEDKEKVSGTAPQRAPCLLSV